jgi:protein SCO1/2
MASLKTHHIIVLVAAALLAAVVGFWTGSVEKAEPELLSGTDMRSAPRALPDFILTDHNGKTFDNARLKGHWTLMFFGYTHCPDICPTTLTMLKQTMAIYLEKGGKPSDWQVVFVSVDPERDSPKQLAGYVTYFNKDFLGVTGDPEQIALLTRSLGILYVKEDNPDNPENYLVDHSASIIVVDPEGREAAVLNPPHKPVNIVHDMLRLAR